MIQGGVTDVLGDNWTPRVREKNQSREGTRGFSREDSYGGERKTNIKKWGDKLGRLR